jgi:hypothetical protein
LIEQFAVDWIAKTAATWVHFLVSRSKQTQCSKVSRSLFPKFHMSWVQDLWRALVPLLNWSSSMLLEKGNTMFHDVPKFVSKFSNDSFRTFLTFWSFQAPLHLDRFFDLRTLRSFGALCTRPRDQRSPTGCGEADAQTGSARCTVAWWDLVTMKTCEVLLVDYWGLYFQYYPMYWRLMEIIVIHCGNPYKPTTTIPWLQTD